MQFFMVVRPEKKADVTTDVNRFMALPFTVFHCGKSIAGSAPRRSLTL